MQIKNKVNVKYICFKINKHKNTNKFSYLKTKFIMLLF